MRRALSISLSCIAACFWFSFVSAVPAQAAKPSASAKAATDPANAQVVQDLHSAHKLLAEADHDYQGHRVRAMHHIHLAVRELDGIGAHPATQAGGHAKQPGGHEPQATSDAQLRQAQQILQGIAAQLKTTHPKAAEHVEAAIAQIKMALSIR